MDRSRGGRGVACYIFCRNIESCFIDIFLLMSKSILVGVLYRPPDEPDFIEHQKNSLKESNISNTRECYLIGDFSTQQIVT